MNNTGLRERIPDADLWTSVQQGSVPAFEVVVDRYQSLVSAVAYNACGDFAFSEDIAQEAFWSAWRARASLAEPNRLGAWLCGIARNLGHNARRRAIRSTRAQPMDAAMSVPADELGPLESAISREDEDLVWRTLQQIPETYREPLILFYREDQSVAEVAAALDLSTAAVKQRLSRGRDMLQTKVTQFIEAALRRSRPGKSFTASVLAGLTAISTGTESALAAATAGPVAKVAITGFGGSLLGSAAGFLSGIFGGWLGTWLPSQLAETKHEKEFLRRTGKRIFLMSLIFLSVLCVLPLVADRFHLGSFYLAMIVGVYAIFFTFGGIAIVRANRALRRLRANDESADRNDTWLRARFDSLSSNFSGRVYQSKATLLGVPIFDVNVSDPGGRGARGQRRIARGWIAVGDNAYGIIFALGRQRAYGLIAFGQFAVGAIAAGGCALGVVALGGVAVGVFALGGFALGWEACGGAAFAMNVACGGAGIAWHAAYGGLAIARDYAVGGAAWASHVNDDLAQEVICAQPLKAIMDCFIKYWYWLLVVTWAVTVLAVRIMYRGDTKSLLGPAEPLLDDSRPPTN